MGKRPTGVRRASENSIMMDVYIDNVRCREIFKLPPTAANLKYVANLRARIIDEIARGNFDYSQYFPNSKRAKTLSRIPGAAITIESALIEWLNDIKSQIEHTTYCDYQLAVFREWIPLWGKRHLTELTRSDLKGWVAERNCSLKRIRNLLLPLRGMYSLASDEGKITQNPFTDWSPRKKEPPKEKEEIDPFSPAEVTAILEACDGQIRNLFQFAFWSGLRTSELVGLQWKDVDLKNRTVSVRRAVVRKRVKRPKTIAGRRTITLLEPAFNALFDQRQYSHDQDAVFLNPRTGQPWSGDAPIRRTAWQPALRKAQVRYRYPYQTRHTFASTLLTAGENPVWVAGILGHRDWSMIMKVYGRWIPTVAPDTGQKVATLWNNHLNKE
jgi:integrase